METNSEGIKEKRKPGGVTGSKLTNSEILDKAFPAAYIESGLNATEAYMRIKKPRTRLTARVEGSRVLSKPNVKAEIDRIMQDRGLTVELAMDVHKRNMTQGKNLSVSQTAVQDTYKLHGLLKNDKEKATVNVGLIIER